MTYAVVYTGNIGFAEVIQFYKVASREQMDQFSVFVKEDKIREAWDLIQSVLNVRLEGKEFS